MKLSRNQCRSVLYHYFLYEGWLPPGTGDEDWPDVTMEAMRFDDPPLPDAPHLQKERIALDIQRLFFVLGDGVASPLERLKDSDETLGGLAEWCFENQKEA